MKSQKITFLMTVPSILEDFTLRKDFGAAARCLAKLNFVVCGGGGLKASVGRALASQSVTLLNHFGGTELGALAPIFQPDDGYDWRYLRVRSDLGLEMETLNHESRSCRLIGYPFAWNAKFELQDQLEYRSINKSDVKILGRNDDILVLATGEKVLPHPLERALEHHPSVRHAIAFGNGQFEIGILIDPVDECANPEDFVEEIWPSVLSANTLMDGHARISERSAIIVKPPGKDILLTDKGSVQRKAVYTTFESEIASIYAKLEGSQTNGDIAPFDLSKAEETLASMVQLCLPSRNIGITNSDEDFVNLGMDSLEATKLRRMLNAGLRNSNHEIYSKQDLPSGFVYAHPSISGLAKALRSPFNGGVPGQSRAESMTGLVSKYVVANTADSLTRPNCSVVLTGSTGNLGAHLLTELAHRENVDRVVCLLRQPRSTLGEDLHNNLAERRSNSLRERGIHLSDKARAKIQVLPWNVGKDFLGLGDDAYQELTSHVTHIFHGAWPMDFKLMLPSFEPQIKAVRDLIELCRAAHRTRPYVKPRLVLASSIAVVGCYSKISSPGISVPESLMDDPLTTLPIGYAEAKWCCEKVMQSAQISIPHELEPVVVRIGQLSGSQATGFWSEKEHIAAFVKACQDVQAVPNLQGVSMLLQLK